MTGSTATALDISGRRRRHQKGSLKLKHGAWHAGYYGWKTKGAERVWQEQSAILGRLEDYPTEAKIYDIFTEFMREINASTAIWPMAIQT
jgi:hypothetical protein